MTLLMLARRAKEQMAVFEQKGLGEPFGIQLAGKRLGIVGMGNIGNQGQKPCRKCCTYPKLQQWQASVHMILFCNQARLQTCMCMLLSCMRIMTRQVSSEGYTSTNTHWTKHWTAVEYSCPDAQAGG